MAPRLKPPPGGLKKSSPPAFHGLAVCRKPSCPGKFGKSRELLPELPDAPLGPDPPEKTFQPPGNPRKLMLCAPQIFPLLLLGGVLEMTRAPPTGQLFASHHWRRGKPLAIGLLRPFPFPVAKLPLKFQLLGPPLLMSLK